VAEYLSERWFGEVHDVLSATATPGVGDPTLVVSHAARTSDDAEVVHTQRFQGDRLVAWHRGPDAAADLLVSRDVACDRDDLLGRADPATVARRTTMALPADAAPASSLWGPVDRSDRCVPCAPPELTIDVALEVTETPFGPIESALRVRGTRLSVDDEICAEPQLTVRAAYGEVLRWLHHPEGTTRHLLCSGGIEGDVFRLSALSGIVEHRTDSIHQAAALAFERVATRYVAARTHPASIDAFDQIDELTD
jgi:hypothetical protein